MPAWLLPAAIGALGGLAGGAFMKGGKNPADAASPYLQRIPEYGKQAYEPYIAQAKGLDPWLEGTQRRLADQGLAQLEPQYSNIGGQGAGANLQNQYSNLTNRPYDLLNQIMGNYQPSGEYNYRQNQLSRALSNTAAAGGFRGGEYEQMHQGELINSLLGQDMQRWLDNNLGLHRLGLQGQQGLYNTGLAGQQHLADTGLEGLQGISNRGFQSAGGLADYLGGAAQTQGSLAYQGVAQRNANKNSLINAILGAGSMGLGAYAGAGGFGGGYQPLSPGGHSQPLTQSYGGAGMNNGLFNR